MTSTERFLNLLEERAILSARAVANLRAQVAQSPTPIAAESIAKRLVKHGHLTPPQAKRLLATVEEAPAAAKPTAAKPAAAKPKPKAEDDLGFAPIDDEPATFRAKNKRAARSRPEKPAAAPAAQRPAAVASAPAVRAPQPVAAPAARASLFEQEMPTLGGPGAGGLEGLLSDAALAAAAGSPLEAAPAAGGGFWRHFRRQPKVRPETEAEKWGSPLMLLGGGGLLVMLVLGGWLYWTLTRGNAEKVLDKANELYNSGSYPQAKHEYDVFLEAFPTNAQASFARVKKELCLLRQASLKGSDMSAALKLADEILVGSPAGTNPKEAHPGITSEKDFKEAYPELAAMFPDIAEGLAEKARKNSDAALVEQGQRVLAMIDKYVPKTQRMGIEARVNDVRASLANTTRLIARDTELAKTLAAVEKAVKEKRTAETYMLCSALLRQYPDLADNPKLRAKLLEVSRTQQTLVKWVAEAKPAAPVDPPSAAVAAITLARREKKNDVPEAGGQSLLAAVDGAVYGLDAATGKVLWRRFIGFDVNPQAASLPILPLSSEPGGDAVVVDTTRNELLRLDPATGKVRWRAAVGEPFDARVVVADKKIVVATPKGKLWMIAADTGESPGYVQIPQPLAVAPVFDGNRALIYQVAARANLFILSLNDGACRHVDYLGHELGSVVTAPLVIDDFLLLVVNDGVRDAQLQVYLIQPKEAGKPEPWLKLVQQVSLGGVVATPPVADGRRVLVGTTSGIVRIFDLGAPEAKAPLRQIAESVIEGADNVIRFPLLQAGQLFIADNRLAKYDIQAARGHLEPKWIQDEQSAFLQPPLAVGGAVVGVRRKLGSPGAVVSARDMPEGELYWAAHVGLPPAGELQLLDDGSAVAVTGGGAVFKIDAGKAASAVLTDPLVPPDVFRLPPPVRHVCRLAGGLLAISSGKGSQQIGIFDPKSPNPLVTWLKLPDEGKLACAPVAMGRGLLVATLAGQVCLWDSKPNAQNGDPVPLAEPFQPALEVGAKIEWIAPAVVNDRELVIADGKANLYHLGIQDDPKPHLAVLAKATSTKPIVSPLAVLGPMVYATDTGKMLAGFNLAKKLNRDVELPLEGQFAWGPAPLGDVVLLATDDNRLLAIDAKGKRLWQVPLAHGPLAGTPWRLPGQYLVAARDGTIARIDAATGKELAKLDIGCPLATGPVVRGGRVLVAGYDGTLYEVRQP